MTYSTRLRIITLAAVLGFVTIASMPHCATDGDVFVPSRIWLSPVAEAGP